jgi:hypothetical protein
MTAWTDSDGKRMQGIIRYESDAVLKGVCGGAVVVLVDSSGRILRYYTPPTGCGNGKLGGHAQQRFVWWEDDIPETVRGEDRPSPRRRRFTEGRFLNGIGEAIGTVAGIIKTACDAARAVGLWSGACQ